MPDNRTSFFEELVAAGRGVVALTIGDRKASQYFDLGQRGLVGSFIGLLLITLVSVVLPLALPGAAEGYSIGRSFASGAILFAFQVAFAAIVLRQIKRMDGFVPYIVADNWAGIYISAAQLILLLAGIGGEFAFFALSILVIVVEINIGRLIVTLTALQIAMFMIAQLIGVAIALIIVGTLFPSPEVVEALNSLRQ